MQGLNAMHPRLVTDKPEKAAQNDEPNDDCSRTPCRARARCKHDEDECRETCAADKTQDSAARRSEKEYESVDRDE